MDEWTEERYGPLDVADLEAERWPWRGKTPTNTAAEVAKRRRDLWQGMGDDGEKTAA
jgi:hypothetical protein